MLHIQEATLQDFTTIQQIAHKTWPATFNTILSEEQIAYMLEQMYSPASLQEQAIQKGHRFLLALEEKACLGFASYESNYLQEPVTKIHKLYVLPNTQGKGIGKALIHHVSQLALAANNVTLRLNVNRYNRAVTFYQHLGFHILGQEDIAIGRGFLMEDYIMEKPLPNPLA